MMSATVEDIEFGLNSFGDVATDAGRVMSDAESLRLLVDEAQLAESVGLDVFSIGEHYKEDSVDSATPVVLAAAAQATSRIHLGTSVTVLSTQDPVRLYQQFATVEDQRGAPLGQPAPVRVHQRRTGARSAGERQAGAAFPHAQPDAVGGEHLGEADIGPLGEQWIVFQRRPKLGDRQRVQIGDKESRVRIAHARRRRLRDGAVREVEPQRVHRAGERDVAPVEAWGAHVHLDLPIPQDIGG